MPNTEIAEKIHISESTARRRINRLINEEIIKIVTVRNPDQFNKFTSSIIGVSCDRIKINSIESYLTKQKETRYVGYSTGQWDIMIEAFFIDNEHLLEFLLKLGELDGVNDVESSIILRVAKFAYEWEVGKLLD